MCDGFQNSPRTLINEKKALGFFEKLGLHTQVVFTCSKPGIETLEQVRNTFKANIHC